MTVGEHELAARLRGRGAHSLEALAEREPERIAPIHGHDAGSKRLRAMCRASLVCVSDESHVPRARAERTQTAREYAMLSKYGGSVSTRSTEPVRTLRQIARILPQEHAVGATVGSWVRGGRGAKSAPMQSAPSERGRTGSRARSLADGVGKVPRPTRSSHGIDLTGGARADSARMAKRGAEPAPPDA